MSARRDEARAGVLADLAVLSAVAAGLIFWRLGGYSLVNGDEAIYQGIAEQMVASGDWTRLVFVDTPRLYDTFMNAPLQYWWRAALIEAFGSNLWTTRLGSALCGWGAVLATYALGRELRDRATGLLAGAILLTTLQFVLLHGARTGELDTAVALGFALAALLFVRGGEGGSASPWRFVPHHLVLVALVNLKLPVVIIPVLAEGVALVFVPRFRAQLRAWLVTGVCVAPVGLAWHLYQLAVLGDDGLAVVSLMLGHATGSAALEAPSGLGVNLVYYGATLLYAAYPFALVYPFAVAGVLRAARPTPERDRWIAVALFPAALVAFHLAIAAHLRQYLIPAYPFLSVFAAAWLRDLAGRAPRPAAIVAAAVIVTGAAWQAVDFAGLNPFAMQANRLPMPITWRGGGGTSTWIGVVATALALAVGMAFAVRTLGTRAGRTLAIGLTAVLLVLATVRVALPLRYVGHQSEMARLRARIDTAQAAGTPIELPIAIREAGLWRARYYFARDFRVLMRTRPGERYPDAQLLLVAKPAEPTAPQSSR